MLPWQRASLNPIAFSLYSSHCFAWENSPRSDPDTLLNWNITEENLPMKTVLRSLSETLTCQRDVQNVQRQQKHKTNRDFLDMAKVGARQSMLGGSGCGYPQGEIKTGRLVRPSVPRREWAGCIGAQSGLLAFSVRPLYLFKSENDETFRMYDVSPACWEKTFHTSKVIHMSAWHRKRAEHLCGGSGRGCSQNK